MESIAPMARSLAESNGIDWRVIQGSGEGGQIVEQDILNYLMRIMNGEEEPPTTPVDEPPPDWTGEMPPLPSMEMMAQAGIESDITDFVASSARPTPTPQSVPGTAALTSDLDQDAMDFELDDDTGIPEGVAPQTPPPAPLSVSATTELAPEPPAHLEEPVQVSPVQTSHFEAPMDIAEGAPDSDVELAEPMRASEPAPAPAPWQPAATQQPVVPEVAQPEPTLPQVMTPPPAPQAAAPEAPAAQAAGGFALGSLLSRLYKRKDGQPEAPAAPTAAQPEPAPVAHFEAAPQPVAEAPTPEPVSAAPAFEAPLVEAAPVAEAVEPAAPVADLEDEPQAAEAALEIVEAAQPEALDIEPPQVEAVEPVAFEPEALQPEPVQSEAVQDEPIQSEPIQDEAVEPEAVQPEEVQTEDLQPAAVAPLEEAAPEVAPAPEPVPAPLPSAPVAARSLSQRRGVHLRLNVNTAALEQAAAQLGEHLGQGVAAELLVARAAARCLAPLGLSSVAVADLADGVNPRASAQLHGSDLRAAVAEYHAGAAGDWADLMVVDAGALGLDELHLTEDLTTLSLGQRDGGQAALTLTGGVSPQAGAAFLKQVAELLQTPIKLLF